MNPAAGQPVLVIGSGGHAKVVIATLQAMGAMIVGATDADAGKRGTRVLNVAVIGDDDEISSRIGPDTLLANGIGGRSDTSPRRETFERLRSKGYRFATLIHPSATIGPDVRLEEGSQVMAGAVIQPGVRIGENAIVNTRACVDHDSVVGAHAHVAPGATVCGGVAVGQGAWIGAGATVIQGISVGARAQVGAGATVTTDVAEGTAVRGVPARQKTTGK